MIMEDNRRQNIPATVAVALKNTLVAILSGKLLLRLNVGQYFFHIMYVFLLFTAIIWLSIKTEQTLSQVEKNNAELRELEIVHNQMTYELVRTSSRHSIEELLNQMGSDVKEAGAPATILTKRDRTQQTSQERSATV